MKKSKFRQKTQNLVEYGLFRGALAFFGIFPYRFTRWFLSNLLLFAGYYLGVRKHVAESQMRMVFPEKSDLEIRKLLKAMYWNLGITVAEIYFGNVEKLAKECKTENIDYIFDVLKQGKGVLVNTGHFGNWELAMHVFAEHQIPMAAVTKRQRNPYFDEYTYKWRAKSGLDIIYKDEAGRNLIKALRANKSVVLLIDQDAGHDGVLTDFLGHPASTYKGIAKMAIHSKVPIVSAFMIRNEDGSSTAYFVPPIYPDQYPDTEEGVQQLTQDASKLLEKQIMARPELWFWVHRRWKGAKKLMEQD
ncbi:MAG TPA: lysophospholipid acyltransferase family protein [Candidatus Cloacimonadota bacterium]|nr:lysophospholipid acyltransferase family protein [Candidatus Cloacimonadota bacterium]HPT72921.1 lysophospholipid acyltransferase family protein [Candidatus Cloacimonadota bacterium]